MGNVDEVGRQIRGCVEKVGCNKRTKMHCVGDGAPWIANQIEEQFGSQASYLVDFFHVCEYLAAAAPACCDGKKEKEWLDIQKTHLKEKRLDEVLSTLRRHCEPSATAEEQAPVRRCYRYLDNRRQQLDYAAALAKGLPIGSGEIESAHRYVIQKRLKITGAWWNEENAADMLALRVVRANNEWENYWRSHKAA